MVRRRNIQTLVWWGILILGVFFVCQQIFRGTEFTQNYKKNILTEQYLKLSRCMVSQGSDQSSSAVENTTHTAVSPTRLSELLQEHFLADPNTTVPLPYEVIHDQYFRIKYGEALLFGKFRDTAGFLTIGIPTVKRSRATYLEATLESLIRQTSDYEKRQIVVVVFFADQDHDWVIERAKYFYEKYKNQTDEGFIQLVHPHHNSYPDFTRLERKFNDSVDRVSWRSKQNLDYSYLATYCHNISKYYMQIEDDVITASNYVNQIKRSVERRKPDTWFVLSFSRLGFIGKLFRSADLSILADFLLMFFAEKPGDILLNDLRIIKGQLKDIVVRPSLFQHIGVMSSLKNKTQMLVDKGFKDKSVALKTFNHQNPTANIFTNMEAYEDNLPKYAYATGTRFFWTKDLPIGSYYNIVFDKPQDVFRLYVKTGNSKHKQDIIQHGDLLISTAKVSPEGECSDMKPMASFQKGEVDLSSPKHTFPPKLTCISIVVTQRQKNWAIINEIGVFS